MDLKRACGIFNFENPVKDDKEEIEKRYEKLLRKYRNKEASGINDDIVLNDINDAYRAIKESIDENKAVVIDTRRKKIEHFWMYYKFHVIIPIIMIILVGYFVKTVVFKEVPDVNVIMQGDYIGYGEEVEKEFNKITKYIDNTDVVVIRLAEGLDSVAYYRNMMKSATLMASAYAHFYIVDKAQYEKIDKKGGLKNLREILKLDTIDEDRFLKSNKNENVVYGIELKNFDFMKKENIIKKEFYLVITANSPLLKAKNKETKIKNEEIISFINELIKH